MKNALLILLLTLSFSSFAQDRDSIKFSILKKEVQWFIDTTRNLSGSHGRYNIYTVYLYDCPDINSVCFHVSYIQNGSDYGFRTTPHFFRVFDEIVLILNSKAIAKKWIDNGQVALVDSTQRIKIMKKTYRGEHRIHESPEVKFLYWYDGFTVKRRICKAYWIGEGFSQTTIAECTYDDFDAVKKSFYDDSVFEGNSKMKYRYLDK